MIEKYMQAYQPQIHGMSGLEELLYVDGCDEIFPPIARFQLGCLRKARRREPDEPTTPYNLSRSGYVVTCGNCGG
jgi:hypothetical protein